ncbi:MAG TPA: cation diffusion facilitator family transporter [Gaiellaceae bacterium]|nr:cation diffusion facilitator family transporter [Gaiellaceae bacterium]
MGVGHDHARSGKSSSARALALTLVLTATYTVAEVIGGVLTGSLALLADAGHMLSDTGSIAVALVAIWLARRPATAQRSFGFKRAEILAALFNGVTLVAISIWIFIEAIDRFADPPVVLGGWVLAIALGGVAINLAGALILARRDRDSLNVRAALRHVVADLLGSLGVIVAAIVILTTGWVYADPLISVVIGILVAVSSWSVLRESVSILLEATPSGIDAGAVEVKMLSVEGVTNVHDLHIWTITSGFPALSAHVLVEGGEDCHGKRRELERVLESEFDLDHTTLQVDHATEQLLHIASRDRP